jgi:hypothetical protein
MAQLGEEFGKVARHSGKNGLAVRRSLIDPVSDSFAICPKAAFENLVVDRTQLSAIPFSG